MPVRRPGTAPFRVAAGLAVAVAVMAVAAVLGTRGAPPAGAPAAAWGLAGTQLSVGMAVASAGLGLLAAWMAAARRWPGGRRWQGPALAAVVLIQGFAAAPFALHPGRPGVRDPAPLRALHEVEAVPRVMTPLERAGSWYPGDLDGSDGAVWAMSRMAVAPYGVASRVDQIDTYTGIEPARLTAVMRRLMDLGPGQLVALRRFGVTHAVLPADARPDQAGVRAAATAGGSLVGVDRRARLEVWALPHRPWAAFAPAVRSVAGEEEARRALVELEAAGDPAVVIVGPAPAPPAPGTVHSVERHPGALRIDAESTGDSLLVVNDAEWPGWEATIDGRPVEILLADALVRAVRWPAGRHVLEMTYRPPEVRTGIALGVAGVLLAVALAWLPRRRPS
jgi:hypothetical protein